MCGFEKPSTLCVSLRAWLAQSMAASPPPSQPFLHSASYLSHCSSTHELPGLTKGIANHILQLRSLQHRSLSAMIPYYFTVPNLSKQSCHTTDSILLSKHIFATLDCSSAASAPLCLFQEPTKELVENFWAD